MNQFLMTDSKDKIYRFLNKYFNFFVEDRGANELFQI